MTTPKYFNKASKNKSTQVGFVHIDYPAGGVESITSMLAEYFYKNNCKTTVFAKIIHHSLLTDKDKKYINFVQVTEDDLFNENIQNNYLINQINNLNIDIIVFPVRTDFLFSKIKNNTKAKIIFSYHSLPFYELEYKRQLSLKKSNNYSYLRKWYYLNYRLPKKLKNYKNILKEYFLRIHGICDAFTVLSEPYKNAFAQELNIQKSNKIYTIPNAIPTINNPNLNKKKQILYVGRFSYAEKRIDRLIEIWRNIYQKFPEWEFLLVGDGEERRNLEEQSKNYGLERIKFCGTTNNPYEYYNKASILCLSSQFEGIPLVLLEAQQAGVIPIAFNCSAGVESTLSPSWENGVLIDDFSMQEYENALCQLMSDESLRKQLQQNIIKKAQEYDIEKVGHMWHELFCKMLVT